MLGHHNTYTDMARRRLKVFTVFVLVLIVLLTLIARRIDPLNTEGSPTSNKLPSKRKYYSNIKHSIKHDQKYDNIVTDRRRLHASDDQDRVGLQGQATDAAGSVYEGLTRYGADIHIDYHQKCPKDSLMLSRRTHQPHKTNRCPQVFIVGAKKGGTTSMYQYLSKHPDFQGIRLNESKWIGETFYFAQRYKSLKLSDYIKMFPKGKMTGDASVDNLLHCEAPSRILRTCGSHTKILILLRNPIQRYISNFMMRVRRPEYGSYNNYSSMSETTRLEKGILMTKLDKKGLTLPHNESDWVKYRCLFSCCSSMIYEGMYYVFVMNWLCNFPKENIMFISSEEMFTHPVDIYKQVLTFLGLKPLTLQEVQRITSVVYNKGIKQSQPHHQLTDSDRKILHEFYHHFNSGLLELLNWDTVNWPES